MGEKPKNADFFNHFHSMYQNCGYGSEIAVLKWSLCKLRKIVEQNSLDYKTVSQFVLKIKTEGKFILFITTFFNLTTSYINFVYYEITGEQNRLCSQRYTD